MRINREMTTEEKQEMKEVGSIDYQRYFKDKVTKHEQICTKEKIAFCRRCAYLDFDRKMKMKVMEFEERGITPLGNEKELMFVANNFDFDRFTGRHYFDLKAVAPVETLVFIDFNKVPKHTHNNVLLECKKFQHPCTLVVEVNKWKEWEAEHISKKERKEVEMPKMEDTDAKIVG